jgi:alpha-beta hydrolase superfamily lysophospholipase
LEHHLADLGDVRLHYVEAGSGPLVVLLHGFPEFWYSWRFQIPILAEAGFRVVVPDMRGYNLSDKPPKVGDYRVEFLGRDVERLIRACGSESATVVGHDWGGVVSRDAPPRSGREACDPELSAPQPLFERPVEPTPAEEELVHVRFAGARSARKLRAG